MQEIVINVWSAGLSSNYFYTENRAVANFLKRDFNRPTTYMRGRKVIGWRFCIKKGLEKVILPRIAEILKNEVNKMNGLQ